MPLLVDTVVGLFLTNFGLGRTLGADSQEWRQPLTQGQQAWEGEVLALQTVWASLPKEQGALVSPSSAPLPAGTSFWRK